MSVRTTKYGTECDQNWEDLQTRDCGKFCETCNKPVMDFLNWDRETVVRYMQQHPKTCGRFRMDQIDPNIKTSTHIHFNVRALLFGVFSAWGLSAVGATAVKEKTPTVQLLPAYKPPSAIIPIENTVSGDIKLDPDPKEAARRRKYPKVKWYKKRHYLNQRTYISWQFPFFHRPRRIMGAFNF